MTSTDIDALHAGVRMTQRIENAAIVVLVVVAVASLYAAWWWVPLALFLVFDLSALGYLRSSSVGAMTYNVVHNYVGPALAAGLALITADTPALSTALGVPACSWAFHVAVDRTLGYGLKLPDAFEHTHLGRIGRSRR